MVCNLNARATVHLTDKGKEILSNYQNKWYQGKTYPGYDEASNTLITELWSIMSIFGEHMYNGCEIPFKNNQIGIVKE